MKEVAIKRTRIRKEHPNDNPLNKSLFAIPYINFIKFYLSCTFINHVYSIDPDSVILHIIIVL